jgi:lysyl endopeptidase
MAPFIGLSNPGTDDAPNRVKDWAGVPNTGAGADLPLNVQPGGTIDFGTHAINYGGDVDVYRFYLTGKRVVTLRTSGGIDTVATLMDASGEAIAANDDAQAGGLDSGITHSLAAGTYYIHVAHWDPAATGSYGLNVTMVNAGPDNFTASWWNEAEPGWGVNVNHQGNILVATLFTYDADGTPLWLIMSNGQRQVDGSFQGDLYRVTGPVFNAQPWGAFTPVSVGTMKFTFVSKNSGVMTYTVNGVQVVKNITPQEFSTRPDCDWSDFDRTYAFNYTDLWWTAAEPGWGINLEHQDNIIFATLFTYDAENKPRWFVMARGARTSNGVYTGELYRTSGPPFNASPWVAATSAPVGSMTLRFTNGNKASLTYSVNGVGVVKDITRQTFASPHVQCQP